MKTPDWDCSVRLKDRGSDCEARNMMILLQTDNAFMQLVINPRRLPDGVANALHKMAVIAGIEIVHVQQDENISDVEIRVRPGSCFTHAPSFR